VQRRRAGLRAAGLRQRRRMACASLRRSWWTMRRADNRAGQQQSTTTADRPRFSPRQQQKTVVSPLLSAIQHNSQDGLSIAIPISGPSWVHGSRKSVARQQKSSHRPTFGLPLPILLPQRWVSLRSTHPASYELTSLSTKHHMLLRRAIQPTSPRPTAIIPQA
jgi:hypothetical protein